MQLKKRTELDLWLLIPFFFFSFMGKCDKHLPVRLPIDVVTTVMIIPYQAHSAKEALN